MFIPIFVGGPAGRRKRPGIRVGLTQKCSRGDSSISHNIIQRRKDAPKTINNHLGLNYPDEPDKWVRVPEPNTKGGYRYEQRESHAVFDLEYIVNYVTPGYATAVYVSASGVERIRTTAESHRRIAIIEVVWTPVLTRRSSRV